MRTTNYVLKPRSHTFADEQVKAFDMTVEHAGKPLGGHNVQVVLGSKGSRQASLDEVVLTLESGWWISLRNQFALAPEIAVQILESIKPELEAATNKANGARSDDAKALWRTLREVAFAGRGASYWT